MADVYTVVGVASGVGATGITAGLGRLLADAGENVLLIDWDRSTPDLAARMGLRDPESTVRDLETGERSVVESAYTGASGVRFIPGYPVDGSYPDDGRVDLSEVLDDLDGIDATVLIDTGDPSTPAAADAFEVSDGVVVVSTPDSTARRHDAVRQFLREDGHQPLGTVLSRVEETTPAADEPAKGVLARVPEVDNPRVLPGGSGDPRTDAYRRLADEIERIESSPDADGPRSTAAAGPTTAEQQSEDGFVTPSLADPADRAVAPSAEQSPGTDTDEGEKEVGGSADEASATDVGGEAECGDSTPTENQQADQAVSSSVESEANTTADTTASATAVEDRTPTESAGEGDDQLRVSRRTALTLITGVLAAISGGSLWIDAEEDESTESSPETATEEVVGFGYGGTPITAGSAAAVSTATAAATTESGAPRDQTETSTQTTTATPTATATPTTTTTVTPTTTSTPTSAPAPPQAGSGVTSGGSSGETSTATTTTTTDDGDDDYGELGYGEGGYGGTV